MLEKFFQTKMQFNADDVSRGFRLLRQLDPELLKRFKSELQTDLKPMAKAIAEKYPTAPYLSGLDGYVSENWRYSQVVGKVSITPGKSRKGVGRNNVVALRMQYKGAIPWVTDMAKDTGNNLTPQGKALVRNIESRYPSWPYGGRIFYKEFQLKRGEVFDKAEKVLDKYIDELNRYI